MEPAHCRKRTFVKQTCQAKFANRRCVCEPSNGVCEPPTRSLRTMTGVCEPNQVSRTSHEPKAGGTNFCEWIYTILAQQYKPLPFGPEHSRHTRCLEKQWQIPEEHPKINVWDLLAKKRWPWQQYNLVVKPSTQSISKPTVLPLITIKDN